MVSCFFGVILLQYTCETVKPNLSKVYSSMDMTKWSKSYRQNIYSLFADNIGDYN